MVHPLRTLLYELFVEPLWRPVQRSYWQYQRVFARLKQIGWYLITRGHSATYRPDETRSG
jgi:hypothetical protein